MPSDVASAGLNDRVAQGFVTALMLVVRVPDVLQRKEKSLSLRHVLN